MGAAAALNPYTAAAGVGLGMIQNHQKQAEYNRQKELAASIEQNSPWTGVHGQMPSKSPNMMDSMMQGGMAGAQFGKQFGGGGSSGGGWGGMSQSIPSLQMPENQLGATGGWQGLNENEGLQMPQSTLFGKR